MFSLKNTFSNKNNHSKIIFGLLCFIFIFKLIFFSEVSNNTDLLDFNHESGFDMLQFQKMAEAQIHQGVFSEKSYGQFAPFYSFFIALFYHIFGANFHIIIYLQMLLGIAGVWLFYKILRFYFTFSFSFIGTALLGFYSVFWVYELYLIRPVIVTFQLLLFLYFTLLLCNTKKKYYHFILYGFIFATGFLIRENQILLLPISLFVIFKDYDKSALKKKVLPFFLGIILISLPFMARYYITYNKIGFSPITPTNVWEMGNSSDSDGINTDIKGETLSILNPQWTLLQLKKTKSFFSGYHIPNNVDYYLVKKHSNIISLFYSNFGIYFSFGILGVLLSLKHWRKYAFQYYIIFSLSFSFIIFMVFSRYRLHIIPLFIFFSVYSLDQLYDWIKNKKHVKSISFVFCFFLILYIFGNFK